MSAEPLLSGFLALWLCLAASGIPAAAAEGGAAGGSAGASPYRVNNTAAGAAEGGAAGGSAGASPYRVNNDVAAAPADLLQFLDGAVLHGALKGVDAAHGLRWEHPDANGAFDLMPAHVDFVRFPQAKSLALAPSCHVRFAGGDDLFGSVVALEGETMEFKTWFGGTLKIPRAAVQTITFLPRSYAIVYEGPADASDWVIAGGRQSTGVRVVNGGGVIINNLGGGQIILNGNAANFVINANGQIVSVGAAPAGPPGPANWTYRDGSFVTAGPGTLARNFNLTGSCTIEFDLTCNGPFSLLLDLYSTTLDRVQMNNSSFLVELDSSQIALVRPGQGAVNDLRNVNMTNFATPGKPARITLHCNQEERSLAVLVDGVEVKRWTDLGGFNNLGTGFVAQYQSSGATVKLSHFKVTKWQGRYEPDIAPANATNADLVSFINHDQAGGKVEGITGGKVNLSLEGNVLHIPTERVRRIDFAQASAVAEPRGPWEVRAVFPGGGSVSFQLEKWDGQSISGHSALFGAVAFQPGSIRQMEFNLDRLRTGPAASPENQFNTDHGNDGLERRTAATLEDQFDALDQ